MLNKVIQILEKQSKEDLLKLKEVIEQLLKSKFSGKLGKRVSKRVAVNIPATCIIEREKEFFIKEHKATIINLSVSGIRFRVFANIHVEDILSISFRSPSTGEKKYIDCQVVRAKVLKNKAKFEMEVAAQAVDQSVVRAYRDMLKNREIEQKIKFP